MDGLLAAMRKAMDVYSREERKPIASAGAFDMVFGESMHAYHRHREGGEVYYRSISILHMVVIDTHSEDVISDDIILRWNDSGRYLSECEVPEGESMTLFEDEGGLSFCAYCKGDQ